MSKIKTKLEKNKLDDEKRKSSLKEKIKEKQTQQNLIKNALSNIDKSNFTNKLRFDSDDESSHEVFNNAQENDDGQLVLFDESDDEDERNTNFEVKDQFKGKEGLKLLSLQSTYGDDDRFKIDERFAENEEEKSDKSEEDNGSEVEEKLCTEEEKNRQLQILRDVLGQPIASNESLPKAKKRTFDMVRYDASNEEHFKFLIQARDNEPVAKKKKEKREKKSTESTVPSKPVSKEKFYEVSGDIKQAFESSNTGFSLLQTFGRSNSTNDDDIEISLDKTVNRREKNVKKNYVSMLNELEENGEMNGTDNEESADERNFISKKTKEIDNVSLNSYESKNSLRNKNSKKSSDAQGVWKESFFFQPDDPRFKEGLDFINKKNSTEAKTAQETFDGNRGKLREVFRSNYRKRMQSNNPFKKKVGGIKIKANKFMKARRKNGFRTNRY